MLSPLESAIRLSVRLCGSDECVAPNVSYVLAEDGRDLSGVSLNRS